MLTGNPLGAQIRQGTMGSQETGLPSVALQSLQIVGKGREGKKLAAALRRQRLLEKT